MRNRLGPSLMLAFAVTAVMASGASAGDRKLAPWHPPSRGESFSVSGSWSGRLAGDLRIDGTSYHLAPNARIYESGKGFIPGGTYLTDRVVSLSGTKVRGIMVVHSIMVRPSDAWSVSAGRDKPVGVEEASSPR